MEEKKPEKEATKQVFNPAGIIIGIGAGFAMGIALNDAIMGLVIGVGLSLVFGLALGQAGKKKDE